MSEDASKSAQATIFVNARLLDPHSGFDGEGALIVAEGVIVEVFRGETHPHGHAGLKVIDCQGHLLMPGLIDIRARTGEPGFEPRETLKSAALAAAAGGITSFVVLPDTNPPIDEPAMVDFITRRGRDNDLVKIYPAGAATKGLLGERMAEIGLMRDAGAVFFSDADHPIVNSKVFSRLLTYAGGMGVLIAHRPKEKWLTEGTCATSGEMAERMGLAASSALCERIALERDLALSEATGTRLLVDMVSTEQGILAVQRAKSEAVPVFVSVSINHLNFNEIDIGDYRTFFRLDPPLRSEKDRLALIEALRDGVIDVIVSDHCPLPAEYKRLPFSESAPGALGLQTLLPALLGISVEYDIELKTLLACVTSRPANLLGLEQGRLEKGAPADIIIVDIAAPFMFRKSDILSKSKNSPFENRTLAGKVLMTFCDGRLIYEKAGQ